MILYHILFVVRLWLNADLVTIVRWGGGRASKPVSSGFVHCSFPIKRVGLVRALCYSYNRKCFSCSNEFKGQHEWTFRKEEDEAIMEGLEIWKYVSRLNLEIISRDLPSVSQNVNQRLRYDLCNSEILGRNSQFFPWMLFGFCLTSSSIFPTNWWLDI